MTKWNGRGVPQIPVGATVQVWFRVGREYTSRYGEGPRFDWSHSGSARDIVAYEIVDDQKPIYKPLADAVANEFEHQSAKVLPFKTDSEKRKNQPIARGCLDYFPDALLAVSELSRIANDKHNPGEPMHWSKDKSADHADCCVRHIMERGKWDTTMAEPVRHSTEAAWRALANLQTEIELEREAKEAA